MRMRLPPKVLHRRVALTADRAGTQRGDQISAVDPPDDIAIDRDHAITVTWAGGHRSRLPLAALRNACPCARCEQLRRTGAKVWSGKSERLRVAGAELVGGWGLGLAWSDGHATGVYEWTLLRGMCPCPDCSSAS